MNSKRLSVIIPVYNDIRVERAIKSVLEYKDESLELIVIDGASTDGTKDVILKMKNDIDIFVSERDSSVTQATNKGKRLASGEWIFVLAADDILICNPLRIIEKYGDDTVDIICGNIIMENEKGKGYGYSYSNPNLKLLDYKCDIRHPASFFRKKLFFQYGMSDETLRCAGDREIFLRFRNNKAKFKFISEFIVIFSYGGISTKNPIRYAYMEDLKISNRYGMNKLISTGHFCYRCLKYYCGKIKGWIVMLFKIKRRLYALSYKDVMEIVKEQNKSLQTVNQ